MLQPLQEEKFKSRFIYILPLITLLFFPTKVFFGLSLFEFVLGGGLFLMLVFILVKPLKITRIHLLLYISFIIACTHNLINQISFGSINYLIRFFEYLIVFALSYYAYSQNSEHALERSIKHGVILLFSIGFIQIAFSDIILSLHWGPEWKDQYVAYNRIRVFSTLDNPLNLLAICAMLFPVVVRLKNKIYLILLVTIMLLSGSKSSILILFFGSLLFLQRVSKKKLIYLLLGISALCLLLLIFSNKFFIIQRFLDPSMLENSFMQRLYVIGSSLEMIKDNLFFGIGYGNFGAEYTAAYIHPLASRADSSFTAENYFLDLLLDIGLIPTVLLLFVVFQGFLLGLRKTGIERSLSESIILFLIMGLSTNLRVAPVNFMLFFILGILYKMNQLKLNIE